MAEGTSTSDASKSSGTKKSDGLTTGVQDRVVMASRYADGSPAQSADFEFIGDKDAVLQGAEHQHLSAAYAALQTSLDPDVNPTLEEQEAVQGPAKAKAKAEVNEHHKGAFA